MNSQSFGLRVAGLIFGAICLGHLWRFFAQVEVHLGRYVVPMWLSVMAAIAFGGLTLWMWILSGKNG